MNLYMQKKQNNPRKPLRGEWVVLFCALMVLFTVGRLSGKGAPEIRVFEPVYRKVGRGVYMAQDKVFIDINTADEALLMQLSGIGAVRAKAISDYRQENGLFSRIEDVLKVPGIGKKTFEQIKDNIIIQNKSLPED